MNNQKSNFSKAIQNFNEVKTKIRTNNSHLQNLKQKVIIQSEKISALQYTCLPTHHQNTNANLKKKNRSNDCVNRHRHLYDSMLQNRERKGSEANTMIEMYLSNIQSNHKKNKSQLYQFNKQSPKNQHQKKPPYFQHSRYPHEQSQTQQKSPTIQHLNSPLKVTTSTTTSSPTLLKTIEKIKNLVEAGEHSIKYSLSNTNRQRSKQLKINDFQIIKYIEQGQFGAVYLAKHITTSFICAIKKIPKHIFGGDRRYINQLIREVKIQSFLQHPNIIRLYACFDDYQNVYLMMQYCSGGNLFISLKKQIRFNQQKVKKYLKQICHAVQYMHDNDIIHRDIKPQNILLHLDLAKICDFGWSINSPLLRETHCGTPLYSSPQMIERKQYDSKVDIWNIGVMTYQFLYGKVPFQIRCEEDLIKIVQDDIYFSKRHPVSPAAKDFIMQCLKKNPKQRLPINKLIDHQFFHQ